MSLIERIRDWWRGYSLADVESVRRKMSGPREPWAIIPVSHEEMRALNSKDYWDAKHTKQQTE